MKEEIVKEYLSKGKLLTPEALEMLMSGESITESGMILTEKDIPVKPSFKILSDVPPRLSEITTEDVLRFYKSRYEKMKDIFLERVQKNFVSLNRLDAHRNEVFVLGMVREIREKDGKHVIDLEDPTACVPIIFEEKQDVEVDDVIAIRAISAKNVLFGKQVIYPDVPLRQPRTGLGRLCVISDLDLHEVPRADAEKLFAWISMQDIHYVAVAGNIGDVVFFEQLAATCPEKTFFVIPGEKDKPGVPQQAFAFSRSNIISLGNPATIEINGLNVLITGRFEPGMLKKRMIGKGNAILSEDPLVISSVPDIVCCGSRNPRILNYKSITIASSGSPLVEFMPVVIDFATRDAIQVTV